MSKAKWKKWTNIFLNSNEAKCTESMLVNVYRWGFNKVRDNQQATHKSGEFTHTSFDRAHLSKSLNLPSTIAGTCPIGFISEERSSNQRKSSSSANTSQMSFMDFPPLVVKEHMYILLISIVQIIIDTQFETQFKQLQQYWPKRGRKSGFGWAWGRWLMRGKGGTFEFRGKVLRLYPPWPPRNRSCSPCARRRTSRFKNRATGLLEEPNGAECRPTCRRWWRRGRVGTTCGRIPWLATWRGFARKSGSFSARTRFRFRVFGTKRLGLELCSRCALLFRCWRKRILLLVSAPRVEKTRRKRLTHWTRGNHLRCRCAWGWSSAAAALLASLRGNHLHFNDWHWLMKGVIIIRKRYWQSKSTQINKDHTGSVKKKYNYRLRVS